MKNWIKELEIKVDEDQEKWLRALYNKISNREDVNYRILRAELHNEISDDFDPNKIDERLANFRGTEITILGVELLHPEIKIIEKTDKVIKSIRELLLQNPTLEDAELDQIHEKTSIDKKELDRILFYITRFREPSFSNGSSGNAEFRCKSLRVGDEKTFDNYLNYKSIDQVIENWLKRGEDENKPAKLKPKSRTRIIKGVKGGF